jgi:hypothetical protein
MLPTECAAACESVPCACRGKVYVFLVNGFDPFDFGRLGDVRRTLVRAGFSKVYDGQFYHAGWFADEMRRLHADEPEARFVVVGFSAGVEAAAYLTDAVARDGITVDLLASIDAPFWSNVPQQQPTNVQQVMNVHGTPLFGYPDAGTGFDIEVPVGILDGVATHPLTLDRIVSRLAEVAGTVPVAPVRPDPTTTVEAPTPRPLATLSASPGDEWDFLKPVNRLTDASPPAQVFSEPTKSDVRAVAR